MALCRSSLTVSRTCAGAHLVGDRRTELIAYADLCCAASYFIGQSPFFGLIIDFDGPIWGQLHEKT
jgi:hypothetical protein